MTSRNIRSGCGGRAAFEQLEGRVLLSAVVWKTPEGYEVVSWDGRPDLLVAEGETRTLSIGTPVNDYWEAWRNHTLTQEQMEEHGLVSMEWQGQQIYARAGEWMVGFERPEPTIDADGERHSNIQRAGPATPVDQDLVAALDSLGLGIMFEKWVGTKHTILINVPSGVDFETLQAALMTLDKFDHVSPNAVFMLDPVEMDVFPINQSPRPAEPVDPEGVTPPAYTDEPSDPIVVVPDDSLPVLVPTTDQLSISLVFDKGSSPFASSHDDWQASLWDGIDDEEDSDDLLVTLDDPDA